MCYFNLCLSKIQYFIPLGTLKTDTGLFLLQQLAFQSDLEWLLFTINYLENDTMKLNIISKYWAWTDIH